MYRSIKTLSIIITVLILSLNNACQAPAHSQSTPAAANVATTPSSQSTTTLGIQNIRVTSPSRDTVTVYPPSGQPSESTAVSARVWETLDFECIAADQPGHKLTYTWSCSEGKLRGNGSKVIWTAPGAGGDYTVTVNVTCDKGESTSLTMNMVVKCCGD